MELNKMYSSKFHLFLFSFHNVAFRKLKFIRILNLY